MIDNIDKSVIFVNTKIIAYYIESLIIFPYIFIVSDSSETYHGLVK